MKRVAALYLPDWPIERLRQAGRTAASPEPARAPDTQALAAMVAAERANECSVPRGGGWRPGARWAQAQSIEALPTHQRPPMRELGRRSEAADPPFRGREPHKGVRSAKGWDGFIDRPGASGVAATDMATPSGSDGPCTNETGPAYPMQPAKTAAAGSTRSPGKRERPASTAGTGSVRVASPPPTVTHRRDGGRVVLAAACPRARALGLRPGMALTQAHAQVPGLGAYPADPAGDAAALAALARLAARRWSPAVMASGPDGLFVDLTGVAHLFGGERAMARRIVRLLARNGHRCRIAVADTAGAAWALARAGDTAPDDASWTGGLPRPCPGDEGGTPASAMGARVVPTARDTGRDTARERGGGIVLCPPGAHMAAIGTLPVAALRLPPAVAEGLDRLGIATVAALAAMPRGPLVQRFGGDTVRAIDRAAGVLPEPFDPVIPRKAIGVTQRFAEPIATAEAIEHWLDTLVRALARALEAAGLGARLVELVADRVDGVPQRIRIGLARPSRDAAHLLRLIIRRIEEVEPGYGIDAMALHVRRDEPLAAQALGEVIDTAPDLAPLIDAVANRIGGHAIWRTAPVESDVPERSVARRPALAPDDGAPPPLRPDDVRRLDRTPAPAAWHPRWPRPVRVLPRPEPLDHVLAELPDRPPLRFTWRGVTHRVVRADGPERVHGEWWRHVGERQAVRDYFRVEDEAGHRFWLFRRGDGERTGSGDMRWFVQGMFG